MGFAVACASVTGACGLDLTGEEFGNPDAAGTASDDGGAASLDGAAMDSGNGFVGDDGTGSDPADSSTRDPNSAPGTCNFAGTWGSLVTIAVSWAPMGLNIQTFLIAPGTGTIKQWIKGVRLQHGSQLEDTTVVCGIQLPDFRGTLVVAGQTYGVLFPDSLFDGMGLPSFKVDAMVGSSAPGAAFSASASAAMLGLTLTNPTTDAWPANVETATDPDNDGTPGVTASVAQGPVPPPSDAGSYSYIAVGIPAPFQPVEVSQKLRLAIRQITEVTGTVVDCDHISGAATIPQIAGAYAINSHVIGCELLDGGDCSEAQASFVDNTQPVFAPSGTTSYTSVRLPAGATCATVRAALN